VGPQIPHGQLARSERRTYPTDDTASEQRGPSKQPAQKSFGFSMSKELKEIPT